MALKPNTIVLLNPSDRMATALSAFPPSVNEGSSLLLCNATTRKFSFITSQELAELQRRRIVWQVEVPFLARKVDIHIGFNGELHYDSGPLPRKVWIGRLLGWWEWMYVIEGWEDV